MTATTYPSGYIVHWVFWISEKCSWLAMDMLHVELAEYVFLCFMNNTWIRQWPVQ